MNSILTIYRKEFLDIIRDRKTLIFALLLPTVAIPLMMMVIGRTVQGLAVEEQRKLIVVQATDETRMAYRDMVFNWFRNTPMGQGVISIDSGFTRAMLDEDYGDQLDSIPENVSRDPEVFDEWIRDLAQKPKETGAAMGDMEVPELDDISPEMKSAIRDFFGVAIQGYGLIEFVKPQKGDGDTDSSVPLDREAAEELLRTREIHAALHIPEDWQKQLDDEFSTLDVSMIFDSTISRSNEARQRISSVINGVSEQTLSSRVRSRGFEETFLEPVRLAPDGNIASANRQTGHILGMILPYLVVVFSFLGGLFPSLDLGAGEKERMTLETLLLSPCSRFEIALGKYLVILTTSLMAALLGVLSIVMSFQYVLPAELRDLFAFSISPGQAIAVTLLAIPPAASFAGIFLALSIYARSFKEAQNYFAPLQFVLIFPAIAPALPGIELSWKTALIPLFNVSLLSRDFLKGDYDWLHYGLTLGSCSLLAAACLSFTIWQFNRESVLFRS